MMLLPAGLGVALVLFADGQSPVVQPAGPNEPVSVERVRQALARRSVLKLPPAEDRQPHFRTEVIEIDWRIATILETVRRELAVSPGSPAAPPSRGAQAVASIDLLQLARGIKDAIRASRGAAAAQEIRRRVQEELAAFCLTHDCSVVEAQR